MLNELQKTVRLECQMGETKPLGSLHFFVQNPASSSSVMESGVSLFSSLYSSHTVLYFPLKTQVLSQNLCKLLSTAKQFSNQPQVTEQHHQTDRTVFYPLFTARLLPTGRKRKTRSSVLLTTVPKGKPRTSSSKKSTI